MKINYRIWNNQTQKYISNFDCGVRYVLTPDGDVFDIKWSEFLKDCVTLLFAEAYDVHRIPIFEGDILEYFQNGYKHRIFCEWDDQNNGWNFRNVYDPCFDLKVVGNKYKFPLFDEDNI